MADWRRAWAATHGLGSPGAQKRAGWASRIREVRPMGRKSRLKSAEAIRREWLRKLKELWEKRQRRKSAEP